MIRVKDPVCGKEFDLGDSQAHEDYRGWAYFFCSDQCHERFIANCDRFVGDEQRAGAGLFPRAKSREAPHG